MKKNIRIVIVAVISMLISSSAPTAFCEDSSADPINADRPGIADGSAVIGSSRLQIETGVQRESHHSATGSETDLLFPTLIRAGINDSLEMRVEGNSWQHARSWNNDGTSQSTAGVTPTSIGMKYHLSDPISSDTLSWGIIGRVFPTWGSKNFKTKTTTYDARLAADWAITPDLSLNPNIGIAHYEDDAGKAFTAGLYAATLGYNITPLLNVFIDTGLQGPEAQHGKTSIIYDTGIAFLVTNWLQLDTSIGWGDNGSTPPSVFWSAGISARF